MHVCYLLFIFCIRKIFRIDLIVVDVHVVYGFCVLLIIWTASGSKGWRPVSFFMALSIHVRRHRISLEITLRHIATEQGCSRQPPELHATTVLCLSVTVMGWQTKFVSNYTPWFMRHYSTYEEKRQYTTWKAYSVCVPDALPCAKPESLRLLPIICLYFRTRKALGVYKVYHSPKYWNYCESVGSVSNNERTTPTFCPPFTGNSRLTRALANFPRNCESSAYSYSNLRATFVAGCRRQRMRVFCPSASSNCGCLRTKRIPSALVHVSVIILLSSICSFCQWAIAIQRWVGHKHVPMSHERQWDARNECENVAEAEEKDIARTTGRK